jgi:hypothetical protein
MIIWGNKVSQLQSQKLENEYCSKCGKSDAMFIFSYVKYIHVFWIPFLPTGKLCVHACGHCSKTANEQQMTPNMKAVSTDLKRRSSIPAWTFIGLLILAGLTVYGIIAGK